MYTKNLISSKKFKHFSFFLGVGVIHCNQRGKLEKSRIHFAAYICIQILAPALFPVFDMYGPSYMSVTHFSICLPNAPQRRHTSKLSQIQTNEGEVAAVLGGNLNWKCAYTCSVLGPVYFRKPLQLVVVLYKGAGQPATSS